MTPCQNAVVICHLLCDVNPSVSKSLISPVAKEDQPYNNFGVLVSTTVFFHSPLILVLESMKFIKYWLECE